VENLGFVPPAHPTCNHRFDVNQDHGHAFFAPLLRREFLTVPAKARLPLDFEIDKRPIGQPFIQFRMGEYVFPELR